MICLIFEIFVCFSFIVAILAKIAQWNKVPKIVREKLQKLKDALFLNYIIKVFIPAYLNIVFVNFLVIRNYRNPESRDQDEKETPTSFFVIALVILIFVIQFIVAFTFIFAVNPVPPKKS